MKTQNRPLEIVSRLGELSVEVSCLLTGRYRFVSQSITSHVVFEGDSWGETVAEFSHSLGQKRSSEDGLRRRYLSAGVKNFRLVIAQIQRVPDEADLIVYLDPDVMVFNPLSLIDGYMGDASIGLVPHILAPEESEIRVATGEEESALWKRVGLDRERVTHIPPEQNAEQRLAEARFGTELWKVFVLLALLCAVIEMIVGRAAKHQEMEVNT